MVKKWTAWLLLAAVSIACSGCATVFKGDRSRVRFDSDPEDAAIYINGELYGRTPLRIELNPSNTYTIEFRKPGYQTIVRRIENHIGAGWVILDVICGMVPVLIDALTGAWYELDQHHVDAVLERQQPH